MMNRSQVKLFFSKFAFLLFFGESIFGESILSRLDPHLKFPHGEKCEKLLAQVDVCAAQIFYYFNPNLTIYQDKNEMDEDFCR